MTRYSDRTPRDEVDSERSSRVYSLPESHSESSGRRRGASQRAASTRESVLDRSTSNETLFTSPVPPITRPRTAATARRSDRRARRDPARSALGGNRRREAQDRNERQNVAKEDRLAAANQSIKGEPRKLPGRAPVWGVPRGRAKSPQAQRQTAARQGRTAASWSDGIAIRGRD